MARCNAELTTIAWWQEHLREAATSPVAAASGQSGDRKQELREVAWSGEMLAANPGGRQKHQQLGQATMSNNYLQVANHNNCLQAPS